MQNFRITRLYLSLSLAARHLCRRKVAKTNAWPRALARGAVQRGALRAKGGAAARRSQTEDTRIYQMDVFCRSPYRDKKEVVSLCVFVPLYLWLWTLQALTAFG
jgi:hypothetical protein